MSTWLLKVNGVTKTPAGWGIDWESLQLTFCSWDADELSFSMSKLSILEDPIFAYGQDVTLYNGTTIWFVGRIVQPEIEVTSIKEVQKYTAKNAWDQLENLQYEQERITYSASDGFTSPSRVFTTRSILAGRVGTATLGKIDTKDQMNDLIDYAINQGVPIQRNVNFSGLLPPYEEAKDITVAAAMRRMAAWTPDCATRFDYSTTPPTIYIRRRTLATVYSLDLTAVDVGGLFEFSPMRGDYKLRPSGVEISFVSGVTNPTNNLRFAVVNKVSSARALLTGIDRSQLLRGTIFLAADGSFEAEATPTELAQAYEDALNELFWNTDLKFVHQEVPGTYRPGNLINLLHGQTDWATAKAIIQRVVEVPAKGLTVVTCGRPPMLNQGTLAELQRRISNVQNNAGLVSSVFTGYTETPDKETFTGNRTLVLNIHGNDDIDAGPFSGTVTVEIEFFSRVSCRVKVNAFDCTYVPDGSSGLEFRFWGLSDSTGGTAAPSGSSGLNIWGTAGPTGTLLLSIRFKMLFDRTGFFNGTTHTNANLAISVDANP